jgi:hypothetical protein
MTASRRAFLRAVPFAVFIVATGARAQDPRASAANAAARDWLALVDRDDVPGSYKAAGAKFRKALGEKEWAAANLKERKPRGAVTARTLFQTALNAKVPESYGPGEYALLGFRTSFAKQLDARETVTLERESDGVWRVIGYFVR